MIAAEPFPRYIYRHDPHSGESFSLDFDVYLPDHILKKIAFACSSVYDHSLNV